MFYKSLRTLPLYRFHKFNLQHSKRNCIQLCLCRKLITSSYCCANAIVSDIKRLQTLFQCTTEEADKVDQVLKLSTDQKNAFIKCKDTVEWLNKNGATIAVIRDNCNLLRRTLGN